MATATKRRRPTKATESKAAKATENADAEDMDAEAEAAEAQREADERKLASEKDKLAKELGESIAALKTAESETAIQVRERWIEIGRIMNRGKSLFAKVNPKTHKESFDKTGFGNWMQSQGFDAGVCNRNARTHAMWLADIADNNADLMALIPTEGTNVKRSPTTIYRWYIDEINTLLQDAHEAGVAQPGKDATNEATEAKVANLFDWAKEYSGELPSKSTDKAEHDLRTELARNTSPEKLVEIFIRFKPKKKTVAFADREIDDAAEYLVTLLSKHDEAMAVYEAMKAPLEAKLEAMTEEDDIEEDDIEDQTEDTAEDFEDEGDGFDPDDWEDEDEDGED